MTTTTGAALYHLQLTVPVAATSCVTTAELQRRDEEIARTLSIIGTRTFEADLATTRKATERAFLSLGYDVLWCEGTSVATGALVEQKSNVGTIVETANRKTVNVGVVQTAEIVVTRSYEGRFEPMPDGRTRVVLTPRIKFGDMDITSQRMERERRFEQDHFDRIFNEAVRLMSTIIIADRDPVDL